MIPQNSSLKFSISTKDCSILYKRCTSIKQTTRQHKLHTIMCWTPTWVSVSLSLRASFMRWSSPSSWRRVISPLVTRFSASSRLTRSCLRSSSRRLSLDFSFWIFSWWIYWHHYDNEQWVLIILCMLRCNMVPFTIQSNMTYENV